MNLWLSLCLLIVFVNQSELLRCRFRSDELAHFILKNLHESLLRWCWVVIFKNLLNSLHKSLCLSLKLILCFSLSQFTSQVHLYFLFYLLLRVPLSDQITEFSQCRFCRHIASIINIVFLKSLLHDWFLLFVNILRYVQEYFTIFFTGLSEDLKQLFWLRKICSSVAFYHIPDDVRVFKFVFQDLCVYVGMNFKDMHFLWYVSKNTKRLCGNRQK